MSLTFLRINSLKTPDKSSFSKDSFNKPPLMFSSVNRERKGEGEGVECYANVREILNKMKRKMIFD